MGFFQDLKDALAGPLQQQQQGWELGQELGQQAYAQGLEPDEVSWSTVERCAVDAGVDLNSSHYVREAVTDGIDDSWEDAAYEAERKAAPRLRRFFM